MISAHNITMQFGPKPLFENISVKFGEGHRYGLIGANGCGKSTFMKILGGDLEPTHGNVTVEPNIRLGKLRQDQFAFEDVPVLDVVMMGHTEMWAAMQERDAIYANENASDDDYMRAAELEAKFAEYGGYEAQARAGQLLLGLGIPEEQHAGPMREIAPGWKLRVLLAQALFSNPDVLLLDEPTNNLDINTIRWLEGVLNERDSTMVIISHDRHFLNAVCTHMADIDYGTLTLYPGNYDDYALASAEAKARVQAANARTKERIGELQEFVQRFSANKSKARQATSRTRMIAKLKADQVVVKPSSRQHPFIRFEVGKPLHRLALEAQGLSKTYQEPVFSDLGLMIEAGEKLAVIGANGAGKTTLLRTLVGPAQGGVDADGGQLRWSDNADVGYMPQDVTPFFSGAYGELTVFEWMQRWGQPGDDDQAIRAVLGRLLFSNDEIGKRVKVLSGGEKGRMFYGRLLLGRHNVLVMDEPTNHMDMESIEALQLALERYTGTVLLVSHDREFVAGVASRIIELQPGQRPVDYGGGYDDYLRSRGIEA